MQFCGKLLCHWPFCYPARASGSRMFDFTIREKLLLAAALIVGVAVAVLAVVAAVDYIMNDPNKPFTRASGLEQRAADTEN